MPHQRSQRAPRLSGRRRRQTGFTLIEALVTMIVIALGLLGNAALIVNAAKLNKGGSFRTQAVAMSQDIAERMEANPAGALAGAYAATGSAQSTASADCTTSRCTADSFAAYDLANWQATLANALPGASWTISQTSAAGANPSVYNIQVSWTERRASATYSTTGTAETFSYTTSKTVYQ